LYSTSNDRRCMFVEYSMYRQSESHLWYIGRVDRHVRVSDRLLLGQFDGHVHDQETLELHMCQFVRVLRWRLSLLSTECSTQSNCLRLWSVVLSIKSCIDRSSLFFSSVDYTQYWTGFQNNTYSAICTPKINYGVPSFTCVSSYQCRDYNYITCISGVCNCNNFQYWDGTMCAPRLNYS
jgi:hypothetical protein